MMETRTLLRRGVIITRVVFLMMVQLLCYSGANAQDCGTSFPRGGAQGGGYASGGNAQYTSGTASTSLTAGWNLVSNPVANAVPGDSLLQLFPTSLFPYAFSFNAGGGYQQRRVLTNGIGYWAKFPGPAVQEFSGTPITNDSVPFVPGWNLIGSLTDPLDTAAVSTLPPGLRASVYFGFSAGYAPTSQILPGMGYFVKFTGAGLLIMAAPPAGRIDRSGTAKSSIAELLNSITISDAAGGTQTLYFGPEIAGMPMTMFDMPPFPPDGVLDARFEGGESGTLVRMHAPNNAARAELPVALRSATCPLTVSWNIRCGAYELTDGIGGAAFTPEEMRGEGSMTIANSAVQRLIVRSPGGVDVPREFSLAQNYPNPFNPTTEIRFGLPGGATVTLTVFDLLGRKVADLAGGPYAAGYHSVTWNAAGVASGVYLLRFTAANDAGSIVYTGSTKLLLVK